MRCEKKFKRLDSKKRHEKTCVGKYRVCQKCNKRCSTAHGLHKHIQRHKAKSASSTVTGQNSTSETPSRSSSDQSASLFRCRRCSESFQNRRELYLHGMRQHLQVGGALQARPWSDDNAPWIRDGEDERLREVYEANAPLILAPHNLRSIRSIYNFPLDNDVTLVQLMDFGDIYTREQRAFRLNIIFGTILQHRETGQYRNFVPHSNNAIFERPFYISKRSDLSRLRLHLRRMDILGGLLRQRPNSKWFPLLVTNTHFTVFNINYPLGQGRLPEYLIR